MANAQANLDAVSDEDLDEAEADAMISDSISDMISASQIEETGHTQTELTDPAEAWRGARPGRHWQNWTPEEAINRGATLAQVERFHPRGRARQVAADRVLGETGMDYLPELAHFGATGDLPETDYSGPTHRRELYAEIESERGVVDHFYGPDAGAQQLADLDHLEIMLNRHYQQTAIDGRHTPMSIHGTGIEHLINPGRSLLLTEPYQHLAPAMTVFDSTRYAGIEEGEIDHPVGLIGGSIGAEHYGFRDMDASARIAGDYDLYDASGDDAYFADDESYFDDDENFTGGSPDMNLRGPDYSQPDPFGPAPAEGTAAEFTEYLAGVDRRQTRRMAEYEDLDPGARERVQARAAELRSETEFIRHFSGSPETEDEFVERLRNRPSGGPPLRNRPSGGPLRRLRRLRRRPDGDDE
jgi:hypothetical protein